MAVGIVPVKTPEPANSSNVNHEHKSPCVSRMRVSLEWKWAPKTWCCSVYCTYSDQSRTVTDYFLQNNIIRAPWTMLTKHCMQFSEDLNLIEFKWILKGFLPQTGFGKRLGHLGQGPAYLNSAQSCPLEVPENSTPRFTWTMNSCASRIWESSWVVYHVHAF